MIRNITPLTILFFVLLLPLGLNAQNEFKPIADLNAFSGKIEAANKNLETISSDFIQKKQMPMLEREVVSKGKFYYSKPNKLSMDYSTPVSYLMVINGEKMKTVSEGKASIIDAKSNKMMQKMKGMIEASMTGDLKSMSADYNIEVSESANQYYVNIQPKDKAVLAYIQKIAIYLDKSDYTVARLRMDEPSGSYTDYLFTNKKKNGKIDDKIFSVQP